MKDYKFEKLSEVLEEIALLKKESDLLGSILRYYNTETMTFDIPEEWKRSNVTKLPAESPRHLMLKKIKDALCEEDLISLGISLY